MGTDFWPPLYNQYYIIQINRVLDRLIDKQFKEIINEVIAFKMHYITCLLEEVSIYRIALYQPITLYFIYIE